MAGEDKDPLMGEMGDMEALLGGGTAQPAASKPAARPSAAPPPAPTGMVAPGSGGVTDDMLDQVLPSGDWDEPIEDIQAPVSATPSWQTDDEEGEYEPDYPGADDAGHGDDDMELAPDLSERPVTSAANESSGRKGLLGGLSKTMMYAIAGGLTFAVLGGAVVLKQMGQGASNQAITQMEAPRQPVVRSSSASPAGQQPLAGPQLAGPQLAGPQMAGQQLARQPQPQPQVAAMDEGNLGNSLTSLQSRQPPVAQAAPAQPAVQQQRPQVMPQPMAAAPAHGDPMVETALTQQITALSAEMTRMREEITTLRAEKARAQQAAAAAQASVKHKPAPHRASSAVARGDDAYRANAATASLARTGWVLKGATAGSAVLEQKGTWMTVSASNDSKIPGWGQVLDVRQVNGEWVVVTEGGIAARSGRAAR